MANFNVNIISGSVELREGDLLLVNSESTINVRTELNRKENITNRAYTLNAESTNDQYPTAKTVYDFVSSSVAEVPKVEEVWVRGEGSGSAVLSGSGGTTAGQFAIAEGQYTTASGRYSHAEGSGSLASGHYSHAEGNHTRAPMPYEHAQGQYNATRFAQIFSVGVGDIEDRRKNAISIITGSNPSASIYIYGIDSYIGNNPVPGTNDLASVIAKISASAAPTDLTGLFASASYDSGSKKIYFYDNNGTASGEVDATAFIKDGMVNTVTIDTGSNQMIITFNTDAGKEDIALDLTQIFNPNNYYTKTEVNTISSSLSASVAGKQDYFADVENSEDGVYLIVPGTGSEGYFREYAFRVLTNDGEWASGISVDPDTAGLTAGDFRTASAELSLVTEEENSPHVDLLLLDQRTSQRAFYQMGVDGIDLNQKQVHSLADPTSSQDAATKNYVDTVISNIPSVDTSSLVKNNQTGSWASASAWVTANSASALAVSPASVTASINAAIGAATASHHTHSNKTVLDGITAAKTASWEASGTLAKNLTAISASLIASGTLAKNVTAITASLIASASVAKTASSSAAALSAKSASWDAKVGLPTVTAADNGKILQVVNGAWTLVSVITVYSGSAAPSNDMGNNGDIYLQS